MHLQEEKDSVTEVPPPADESVGGGGDTAEWEDAMETEKMEGNTLDVPKDEVLVNDGLFVRQQPDQMTVGVASTVTEL